MDDRRPTGTCPWDLMYGRDRTGIVVLVGVDGSDAGNRAVAYARDRAKALDGKVVLAHVIPRSPYSFTTPAGTEERPKRRVAELADVPATGIP